MALPVASCSTNCRKGGSSSLLPRQPLHRGSKKRFAIMWFEPYSSNKRRHLSAMRCVVKSSRAIIPPRSDEFGGCKGQKGRWQGKVSPGQSTYGSSCQYFNLKVSSPYGLFLPPHRQPPQFTHRSQMTLNEKADPNKPSISTSGSVLLTKRQAALHADCLEGWPTALQSRSCAHASVQTAS